MKLDYMCSNDELAGIGALLNPFAPKISAARGQMTWSHITQTPSQQGIERPIISTGYESQLAEFTFGSKIENDSSVISTHRKFERTLGGGGVDSRQSTIVLFHDLERNMVDYAEVNEMDTKHLDYGSKFKLHPMLSGLREGSPIPAGTSLSTSPMVQEDGTYAFGTNVSYVDLSIEGTIEDGVIISDELAKKMCPTTMGKESISVGKKTYFLNLYGDENNYKPFPDVGEEVRPDGLLCATRSFDDELDALLMSPKDLMMVDNIFDNPTYVTPGNIIYDIDVMATEDDRTIQNPKLHTPRGTDVQMKKYLRQHDRYYQSIIDSFEKNVLFKKLKYTNRLHKLVVDCMKHRPNEQRNKLQSRGFKVRPGHINKSYKYGNVDEYRVTIKYKKVMELDLVAKLTDLFGSKSIICDIWPAANMPVDKAGNIAHLISYGKSPVTRLNPGQKYVQFLCACARDLRLEFTNNGLPKLENFKRLWSFYNAISPSLSGVIDDVLTTDQAREEHMDCILDEGIFIPLQQEDPHLNPEMVRRVKAVIEPVFDTISYVNYDGKTTQTHERAFIGEKYFILLEKSSAIPAAISSSPLQHHGLIMGSSSQTRKAYASKRKSTKVYGEAETRLYYATLGGRMMTKVTTLSSSPSAHRQHIERLLENHDAAVDVLDIADNHGNIPRQLSIVENFLRASGTEMVDQQD